MHITNPDPQTQCRLFGLPAEIRNYIYELALAVEPNEHGTVVLRKQLKKQQATVLTLLQTCRLIYTEAHKIFPSVNHLMVEAHSPHRNRRKYAAFATFVQDLAGSRLLTICRLTLTIYNIEQTTTALRRCGRCVALRSLRLWFVFGNKLIGGHFPVELGQSLGRELSAWELAVDALPPSLETIVLCCRTIGNTQQWSKDCSYAKLDREIKETFRKFWERHHWRGSRLTRMALSMSRLDVEGIQYDMT